LTRVTSDVEGVEGFFGGTLARLLTAVIQICLVYIALLSTDLRFGTEVALTTLPALMVAYFSREPIREWLRIFKYRSAYVNARFAEFLNAIPLLHSLNMLHWSLERFSQATKLQYQSGSNVMTLNSLVRPTVIALATMPIVYVLYRGAPQLTSSELTSGTMTLGMMVAFARYAERFSAPMRSLTQEIQVIQEALSSSERVRQLMNEVDESEALGVDGQRTNAIRGDIEFIRVGMGYDPARWILHDVSFCIPSGNKVGIVGPSGAGKTSLVSLIPRLYAYQTGEILIDGYPITTWERSHLRAQIGYVSQDQVVIEGTLAENLLFGIDAQVSAGVMQTLLTKPEYRSLLAAFDWNLNMKIAEGGHNLSSGQKQILAMTRMILRDPRIVILDESTSHMDDVWQKQVSEALQIALLGRTSFIIAHRLETVLECDHILVVDAGNIIEQGSPNELRLRGGYFARMMANLVN